MSTASNTDVVQKLWGFCHTLRHDGIDYGDYIEQITYLLFLKMADERDIEVPKGCNWPTVRDKSGTDLTDTYLEVLRKLGKTPGILGDIYSGAQSRFNNPVNLKKLISLIDETEWTALEVDVKAAAFEKCSWACGPVMVISCLSTAHGRTGRAVSRTGPAGLRADSAPARR